MGTTVSIKKNNQPIGETNRPNTIPIVGPPQLPVNINMEKFKSSTPYKKIISSSGLYSNIYKDCLSRKQTYKDDVKILTEKKLYEEFNKTLLSTSTSSSVLDAFYNDLSKETLQSISMVKNYLLNYLAVVITKIVTGEILDNTGLDITKNSRLLNSNIREAIILSLLTYYDTMDLYNANVSNIIDLTIKSSPNDFSNVFRLYTGKISVYRTDRVGNNRGYSEHTINLYSTLYQITSKELEKIDTRINPEVTTMITLKIFFDKYSKEINRNNNRNIYHTDRNMYNKYIENLKIQMLMYVLETIYVKDSTSSTLMLSKQVQDMIDNSKETYEYDEEDEESCTDSGKYVINMYTMLIVFLLLILLVFILMKTKTKNKLKI